LTLDELPPATVEEIAQCLYDTIPVGVGNSGSLQLSDKQLDDLLRKGMKWALEQEICTQEDIDLCEEGGCMEMADPECVSQRAKKYVQTSAMMHHFDLVY
jgi:tRNA-splicing ligase RtcB